MKSKLPPAILAGIAIAIMLAGVSSLGVAASPSENGNLTTNPSFELSGSATLPESWHGDAAVYTRDGHERHTGTSSLRFVNTTPARYRLCSQKVPLRAGWKCRFGVWVKTKDIAGPESGATICLEWQDAKGKWLGGTYPHGVKGTHDWTRIEEVTRIPDDAAAVTLACYVRRGMTGTAWFDDVELARIIDPPMQVIMRSPVYRGWITSRGPEHAQVRVRLDLRDYDVHLQDVRVHARLSDAHGTTIWESPELAGAKSLDVDLPIPGLAIGNYDLALRLTGPDGKEIQAAHQHLQRLSDDFYPRCWIDEHRRLIVEGKPFFPLGMYFSGVNEADLKTYSASKFNCLMPYEPPTLKQMDLAARYELKVIYSLKDLYFGSAHCSPGVRSEADEEPLLRARVRQFRNHRALLAWYLNDELSLQYLPRLEAHQRWVAEDDPNHPTWSVVYQVDDISGYINSFDCIGSDPYPIARKPASLAAEWSATTFNQVARSRPMWQVPQAFNWSIYGKNEIENQHDRTPTFEEERSMAWQCICEGATGLVFYSWTDIKRNPDVPFATQWDRQKRIAAEFDGLAPALLSVEPAGAVKVHDAPRWLHCLTRHHDGKLYLFAVDDGDGEAQSSSICRCRRKVCRS